MSHVHNSISGLGWNQIFIYFLIFSFNYNQYSCDIVPGIADRGSQLFDSWHHVTMVRTTRNSGLWSR